MSFSSPTTKEVYSFQSCAMLDMSSLQDAKILACWREGYHSKGKQAEVVILVCSCTVGMRRMLEPVLETMSKAVKDPVGVAVVFLGCHATAGI